MKVPEKGVKTMCLSDVTSEQCTPEISTATLPLLYFLYLYVGVAYSCCCCLSAWLDISRSDMVGKVACVVGSKQASALHQCTLCTCGT